MNFRRTELVGLSEAQSVQGDGNKALDLRLRVELSCSAERVEAVRGQVGSWHVGADVAGGCSLGDEFFEQCREVLLGMVNVSTAVQKSGEFLGAVLVSVVADGGIVLDDRLEALAGVRLLVAKVGQARQVPLEVAVVLRDEYRLDVGKVFVQRRASDAGAFCDLFHRDGQDAVLGRQCPGAVEDRLLHGATVRVDRLIPQLRHD